jgi:hypothetical protein
MANWSLMEEDTLQFWLKTINPHSLQFQQFYIRLGNNCNAYYQFTTPLSNINSTIGNWVKFDVPLAGNTTWTRTSNGEVSFSEIAYFEFNLDTWDWGFEFWIDGVTLNNYLGVGLHEPAKYPEQYYCYPNPFSTQADIRLFLPESGTIELCIYNLHGLKLKEILNQQLTAGRHQIPVDTSNIPPGIYLLELKTKKHKQVKRIIRR